MRYVDERSRPRQDSVWEACEDASCRLSPAAGGRVAGGRGLSFLPGGRAEARGNGRAVRSQVAGDGTRFEHRGMR